MEGEARLAGLTEALELTAPREEDGRMLASVPDLPGVMAYGAPARKR
jgi:predicted RNase H-like HicB family nuclease